MSEADKVVFQLRFSDDGVPPSAGVFVVPRGETVQFWLHGGSRLCCNPSLMTNYPLGSDKFERRKFRELPGVEIDENGHHIWSLRVERAGAFDYYIHYEEEITDLVPADKASTPSLIKTGHKKESPHGIFLCDPELKINGSTLPLNALSVVTVISKYLPSLTEWTAGFHPFVKSTKYNMVHFTPMQKLGNSKSTYSIADQLSLNSDLLRSSDPLAALVDPATQHAMLRDQIRELEAKCNCLSMVDVVWNHTSADSQWLREHPHSGYNLQNSPHLRAPFLLDQALYEFSEQLGKGVFGEIGDQSQRPPHVSPSEGHCVVTNDADVDRVMELVASEVMPKLDLWEYYMLDEEKEMFDRFKNLIIVGNWPHHLYYKFFSLTDAERLQKFKSEAVWAEFLEGSQKRPLTVRLELAVALLGPNPEEFARGTQFERQQKLEAAVYRFEQAVQSVNDDIWTLFQNQHAPEILRNIRGSLWYSRVCESGPKNREINAANPIVPRYFTTIPRLAGYTSNSFSEEPEDFVALAHNGWVMGGGSVNFMAPDSRCFLLRQVVIWSDSVKLNYGDSVIQTDEDVKDYAKGIPEPWMSPELKAEITRDRFALWARMREYTRTMASIFHGFRIDNAHSTPMHLAQHLLDCARDVNPEMFVAAELFTDSEELDRKYVATWGISALIREAMTAPDPAELGRLVYKYGGGSPVGCVDYPRHKMLYTRSTGDSEIFVRPLLPRDPPGLFFDCTHDNPSPAEVRCAMDCLPNSALVSMSVCATGSVRGYDELVPHKIDVTALETRPYPTKISETAGMVRAKAILNDLHVFLADKGYTQLHVDRKSKDVTALYRHHPYHNDGYLCIVRNAFSMWEDASDAHHVSHVDFSGEIDQVVFAAKLHFPEQQFARSTEQINGFDAELIEYNEERIGELLDITPADATFMNGARKPAIKKTGGNITRTLRVHNQKFKPGSVAILHVRCDRATQATVDFLNSFAGLPQPVEPSAAESRRTTLQDVKIDLGDGPVPAKAAGCAVRETVNRLVGELGLTDMNTLLFTSDGEERDNSGFAQRGVYTVPDYGPLAYCGLHGIIYVLDKIRRYNDMGHPLFHNVRQGDWLIGYILDRLESPTLQPLKDELRKVFNAVTSCPRFLIPKYFDAVISTVYELAVRRIVHPPETPKSAGFLSRGDEFVQALALSTAIFYGNVSSAPLIKYDPRSITDDDLVDSHRVDLSSSLAAGLPFFSTGYMRNWGRDTFISVRGLLLITGRFQEARSLILAYAMCVRHGLVPNLLDGGHNSRYNARDATWWFLQAVQDYAMMAPEGAAILEARVTRMFAVDSKEHHDRSIGVRTEQKLSAVIQEIMQKHANGIHFREWNAGKQIDSVMTDRGFNVDVHVDFNTGFVFGGNEHNCGTWMDKMGSSYHAGNAGVPATPRDGADVEIVGLCKSTVRWLTSLAERGLFPYRGVSVKGPAPASVSRKASVADEDEWYFTYKEWNSRIQSSFEKHFYVPELSEQDVEYAVDPTVTNRRGIYKDVFGSSKKFTDYQLRPNFTVAMAVAPEMFNAEHARLALCSVQKHLLGPLGMRTLDPRDWAYRGHYDNSNDSGDFSTSKGFNYHQGPEWVWCTGFFLRAKLTFSKQSPTDLRHEILGILSRHRSYILSTPFNGLPELTNANGVDCQYSCMPQAWSSSTILEALHDLYHKEKHTATTC